MAPESLPARRQPAAVRRVGVGLEKREQRLLPESGSEVRKYGPGKKKDDGIQAVLPPGAHELRPPGAVQGERALPLVQGGGRDPEGIA